MEALEICVSLAENDRGSSIYKCLETKLALDSRPQAAGPSAPPLPWYLQQFPTDEL